MPLGLAPRAGTTSPRVVISSPRSPARGSLVLRSPSRGLSRSLPRSGATGRSPPGGMGGGGGGSGGSGGSGPWNRDDEDPQPGGASRASAALLLAGKASADFLPRDVAQAVRSGAIAEDMLQRYLDMSRNAVLRRLLRWEGFRDRLLADPLFLLKVGIELGIGVTMKITAEYTKRGEDFKAQLDFVAANVVMALVADWMLVWLPAPTYSIRAAAAGGALAASPGLWARAFAGCPENAFQRVPPGYAPFSLLQRGGAVVRNGLKLSAVGFFASLLGVGVTNAIVTLRARLDPSYRPLNAPQDVAVMSAAYGAYMASSANLRYQIVAGLIEERGIETLFRHSPAVCAALSFAVRTGNTFLGSLLWVDFLRLLRLQPKKA